MLTPSTNSPTNTNNSNESQRNNNSNNNAPRQPQQEPDHFYHLYRKNYANSYNLQFGLKTSLALDWKEYHRLIYNDSEEKTLLDCSIGAGPLCKPFPLPPGKILAGFDSVVVHEFVIGPEKLGRLERACVKNALKVMVAKLFDGVYKFDQHKYNAEKNKKNATTNNNNSNNASAKKDETNKEKRKREKKLRKEQKQELPIQFYFTESPTHQHVLYFAYFYNARVVMKPEERVQNPRFGKFSGVPVKKHIVVKYAYEIKSRLQRRRPNYVNSSSEETPDDATLSSDEEIELKKKVDDKQEEEKRENGPIMNCIAAFFENYRIGYEENEQPIEGVPFIYRHKSMLR